MHNCSYIIWARSNTYSYLTIQIQHVTVTVIQYNWTIHSPQQSAYTVRRQCYKEQRNAFHKVPLSKVIGHRTTLEKQLKSC